MYTLKLPKLLIVFSIIIISLSSLGCGSNDKYVTMVKEGTLYMEPNVPVGKAFDQFFSNGKWKSFENNGYRYVEFNGECTWYNAPAKLTIQFQLDTHDNTFSVYHVGINGTNLDDFDSLSIVAKVLEEYNPKKK